MPFSERDISLALISSLGTALIISVLFNTQTIQNKNNRKSYRRGGYRRGTHHHHRRRRGGYMDDDESISTYYDEDEDEHSLRGGSSSGGGHSGGRYYDDEKDHDDDDDYSKRPCRRVRSHNDSRNKRGVASKRGSMDTLLMNNLSDSYVERPPPPPLPPLPPLSSTTTAAGGGMEQRSHLDNIKSNPNHEEGSRTNKEELNGIRNMPHPSLSTSGRNSDDISVARSTTSEVVSISKSGKTRRKRSSLFSTGSIGSNSEHVHHRGSQSIISLTGKSGEIGGSMTNSTCNDSTLKSSLSKSYKSNEKTDGEEGTSTLDSRSQIDGTSTLNSGSQNEDATLHSATQSQTMTQTDSYDDVNGPDEDDDSDDDEEDDGMNFQLFIGVDESDKLFQEFIRMDQILSQTVLSIDHSLSLLRRARCVNIMGNKLMLAESETQCFEHVSKLLVSLFKVERSSYTLMIDEEHFTILHCVVTLEKFANQLAFELAETGLKVPMKGTAIGYCAETLEALYTPLAKHSKYVDHQKLIKTGLKSFVNVPILVGERQFAGCLNIGLVKEDPFTELDISLIQDIAAMLGTHVFSKRLQRCKNESHHISQQLLHSFIPPQVIGKIEHYWAPPATFTGSLESVLPRDDFPRSISLPEESVESINRSKKERFSNIKGKLELLQEYGNDPSKSNNQLKYMSKHKDGDVSISESYDLSTVMPQDEVAPLSTSHALYAENANDVSIIFSDIVGFSKIAMEVPPIMIMDMLQHLFHLYDIICKKHRMLKLETIGDAYLCAGGLLEHEMDDDTIRNQDRGKSAALRALAMAKDMVREARKVPVPKRTSTGETEFLEVRVGIHVGEVTYGVLGQTIPKLVCIGNTVNMAARMEQTSCSSKIRVTQDFHDLVGDEETGWEKNQIVDVKNMGKVSSWLLDPLREDPRRDFI